MTVFDNAVSNAVSHGAKLLYGGKRFSPADVSGLKV
jgi:hypothetical protein